MTSSLTIFKKPLKPQIQRNIPKMKYRTNFTNCILQAFETRGYVKTIQEDWDIIWSEKDGINQIYQKRLQPHQKVNHFRNYYELCKKDNLIKNLKKYKKQLQKDGKIKEAKQFNFFPQTFLLPSEYVLFADEFKKLQNTTNNNVWIMKPIGKSQGKGIFLVNKLSQMSSWEKVDPNIPIQPYIVQKYINDPLLIGGKKFDIRIYVLVTSYNPLTVYLYRNGFARFTHTRYDETKITDNQIHLTNVAIQKNSDKYDQNIGGKWYIDKLKTYLMSKFGDKKVNQSFLKIRNVIISTLQSMIKIMTHDRQNSFELYGFDILLDKNLDPWLIEVNGSPSMTANTKKDRQLKVSLLDDTLTVLDMEKFLNGNDEQVGGFDLICKKNPKDPTKSLIEQSKMSFLGSKINRQDVYKKLAKINAGRMNESLPPNLNVISQNPQITDRRRVMSQNNHQNPQIPNIPGSQVNKKHTMNILGVSRKNIPPKQGKEFVIKQKVTNNIVRRQKTNENQPIK